MLLPFPNFTMYVEGNMYVDIKEPGTDSFIRLVVPPEFAIFYPGGTIAQASSHQDTLLGITAHSLFRGTDPASFFVFGKEVDKHPARVDYVRSVLDGAEA
ncbi:hypothetical protein AAF712_011617 [Marasmius tenuissimus]|uniref:Uncharacterized protein n=1 Tax=Marasmius tenuissimus TaxID=585030 RepID=A0ABR2ZIV7_9AGAR